MAINATCYKIITDLGTDPEPSQILICYLCYIFNTLTSLDIDVVIVILTYIESAALSYWIFLRFWIWMFMSCGRDLQHNWSTTELRSVKRQVKPNVEYK